MPGNVVPLPAMDNVPISGIEELQVHLDKLVAEPETPIEPKLFDDVELQLTEANIPALLPVLLPKFADILKTTAQDPTPLASLTIKLLGPVPFVQTLGFADEDSLITALRSPAPPANILAMTIVHKAAASPEDVQQLAALPRLSHEFIRRWLSAPQVEVGEKGSRVIGDLLETDSEVPPMQRVQHAVTVDGAVWTNGLSNGVVTNGVTGHSPSPLRTPGGGYLWRKILQGPELGLLTSLVRGNDPEGPALTDHQTSLAQGRLLRVLPRWAALNFGIVAKSPELQHGETFSLLRFVAVDMVDKTDPLMHLCLIDFFETLLSLMRIRVDEGGRDRDFIVTELKHVVKDATEGDNDLRVAISTLPDRTVPEEADGLRTFVTELLA